MEIKRITIRQHVYMQGEQFHLIVNREGGFLYPAERWGEIEVSELKQRLDKRAAIEVLRYAESMRIPRRSKIMMNERIDDGSEVTIKFEYDLARPVKYSCINTYDAQLLELAVFVSKKVKEALDVVDFFRYWKKESENLPFPSNSIEGS